MTITALARADALRRRIEAVCPLVSLTFTDGVPTAQLQASASADQVAAAQQLLASFEPASPAPAEIKQEAERRILTRYPIHRQLNALARSAELMLQGQANWSPAEQAEAAALLEMRAWIKSVRDVSNALEQSLPADFAADARWPA